LFTRHNSARIPKSKLFGIARVGSVFFLRARFCAIYDSFASVVEIKLGLRQLYELHMYDAFHG